MVDELKQIGRTQTIFILTKNRNNSKIYWVMHCFIYWVLFLNFESQNFESQMFLEAVFSVY